MLELELEPFPVGTLDLDRDNYFCISPEHKRRHISVFGKSGVGKSTLLRNMILWDVNQGAGLTVIDPHGGLIDEVLRTIPPSRTNDVIYINPQDSERIVGINIFESVSEKKRPLVVSSVISIMRNIWPDNWGPQTEYILKNASFALLSQPKPQTLIAVPKLLTDQDFREDVVSNITDPVIKGFFEMYDNRWSSREREEKIAPLLNKVSTFTTNPLLRNVIGQPKSSFNFRRAMDSRKIILCDLSKGELGEDVSSLLGSLIVTKLAQAALSRRDIPESERTLHVLYADEVQNFIHGVDFPTILSEARKYRLALTIATQTLEQLPRVSRSAVFGNCSTIIAFRVSGEDAEALQTEFATKIPARLLQDLPDFKLYVRTLTEAHNGKAAQPQEPKLVTALPPIDGWGNDDPERIKRVSLKRFAKPRSEVEANLTKFLSS